MDTFSFRRSSICSFCASRRSLTPDNKISISLSGRRKNYSLPLLTNYPIIGHTRLAGSPHVLPNDRLPSGSRTSSYGRFKLLPLPVTLWRRRQSVNRYASVHVGLLWLTGSEWIDGSLRPSIFIRQPDRASRPEALFAIQRRTLSNIAHNMHIVTR